MIAAGADPKIYLATRSIDFRCGHDGLAVKVQEMLRLDPFSGAAFVFRSKRADRIKILVWDRTGLISEHKRLEVCKFVWQITDGVLRMSAAMFAGLDWRLVRPEEARRRLEVILGELRRDKFGAQSEKLRPDQYHLPLEDVETAQGILDAAQERAEAVIQGRSRNAPDQGSHRSRGCLPAHLPRVQRIIKPASTLCPCGCGAMTKIGEDVSMRLDVIPAQWRLLATRRLKYICRRCSGPVMQAHAPEHVVPGGLPTEAAIAHVIVSKFGDHTPFYRQAEIYARQGIRLDRATMGNWSGRACFHLQPIADHMCRRLAMADRLFMDETTAPILDPGRGQTKVSVTIGSPVPGLDLRGMLWIARSG